MLVLPILVFFLGAGAVVGGWAAITYLPGMLAAKRLQRRLTDVSLPVDAAVDDGQTVVRERHEGPLPGFDRLMARTSAGGWLAKLIEQSGSKTTPSAVMMQSLMIAGGAGLIAFLFSKEAFRPWLPIGVAALGAALPFMWLTHLRARRLKRFEEQFPEALDLLSRAIRAGHAFQTAMGMVADELPEPVGPEFKKTFDQQNFGLPLKDALNELADRIGLLDVRFFVTAVLIQRDTGGNLSEILDNLAHVVRERFKILRQVRVHTAHGRFTGYVLLALPAVLACALMFINPEHMGLLFKERMGQIMVMGAIVMQTIGYFWIRQVIKIEV